MKKKTLDISSVRHWILWVKDFEVEKTIIARCPVTVTD